MPATTGCAEWAPRPARSAPAPRSAEAVAHPRLPVFRRRRYRTSLLPGRSRRELPSTILHDAMCARRMAWLRNSRRHRYAAEQKILSAHRPDEWRAASGARSHRDLNMASGAGGKAFEQTGQGARACGVIISAIRHQLPRLLPDLESATGLLNADRVVLRFEQRTHETRVLLCSSGVTGGSLPANPARLQGRTSGLPDGARIPRAARSRA